VAFAVIAVNAKRKSNVRDVLICLRLFGVVSARSKVVARIRD
jgi:hypothetical protein